MFRCMHVISRSHRVSSSDVGRVGAVGTDDGSRIVLVGRIESDVYFRPVGMRTVFDFR
jgi:hypothetical protein